MMHPQSAAQSLNDDTLKQSRNVYVASLPLSFDDQQLQDLFSPYGRIVSGRIMRAKKSHASKGYGFVMFREVSSAEKAIEGLHGRVIGGSRIQVRRANADASMTFSKVSHSSTGSLSKPSTQNNSTTSVMQYTLPAPAAQQVVYAAALPQTPPGMYSTQPSTGSYPTQPSPASYAIVSPTSYQSQSTTAMAINSGYGTIMNSQLLQTPAHNVGVPFMSSMTPHAVHASVMQHAPQPPQQQQQPVYVVLLPNGQHIIQPNQFAM